MNWLKLTGACALLIVISGSVVAEGGSDLYVGFDGHYIKNSVGNQTGEMARFNMSMAGVRLGFYLEPQVGLELYVSKGFDADNRLGIEVDAVSSAGVLSRFESPETKNGMRLYILLGYGMTELEMQRSATSIPDREIFHGFTYGIGGEFRLGDSDSFVGINGLRYYEKNDFILGGLSVGLRQKF